MCYLLVEAWIEVKCDVAVALEQVDVEALGLLLGSSEDKQRFSGGDSVAGNAGLVWDWLKRWYIRKVMIPLRSTCRPSECV